MTLHQALLSTQPGRLEVVERQIPKLAADEALLQVSYCGVCGSDLARYAGTDVKPNAPQVVWGHEASGVVVEIGSEVVDIAVGARAVVVPLIPCAACDYCQKGHYALCSNYSFIGSRVDGAYAQYLAVPAKNLVELPPELDLKNAVWVEPLTVALHAFKLAGVKSFTPSPNVDFETAIVIGLGAIGLLSIRVLKLLGVRNVVAVGTRPEKLLEAEVAGATYLVDVHQGLNDIIEKFGGASLVLEASGAASAIPASLEIAAKQATILCVGKPTEKIVLSPQQFEKMLRGELRLLGSWMSESGIWPGEEWTTAVSLLAKRNIDVSGLSTMEVSLADAKDTFDQMLSKKLSRAKVLVTPNGPTG